MPVLVMKRGIKLNRRGRCSVSWVGLGTIVIAMRSRSLQNAAARPRFQGWRTIWCIPQIRPTFEVLSELPSSMTRMLIIAMPSITRGIAARVAGRSSASLYEGIRTSSSVKLPPAEYRPSPLSGHNPASNMCKMAVRLYGNVNYAWKSFPYHRIKR